MAIDEKFFGRGYVHRFLGREHVRIGTRLNNLALLLKDKNESVEAERLLRRAIRIFEKSLGKDHFNVGALQGTLASLLAERGDWKESLALYRRAKPILIARKIEQDRTGLAKWALMRNSPALRLHARALHRAEPDSAKAQEEAFNVAQWALQTGAAQALSQMSVRFAKGAGPLADIVRQRQLLASGRQVLVRDLDLLVGHNEPKLVKDIQDLVAELDNRLDAIDAQLAIEFKDYASLANPAPLTIAAVQKLLGPDEALVMLLDIPYLPQFGKLPEETLIWVITQQAARWRSVPLGTQALADNVSALRCGLDNSNWRLTGGWPSETDQDKVLIRHQQKRRERCKELLGGIEVADWQWPPFDLNRAHELYAALLAPFEDLTKAKHLIIVPSGPLASLPFHVLLTKQPNSTLNGMARYRQAAWLALLQPTTILPSVGSLQTLRRLEPSKATQPYIAFGNPLLLGRSGTDKSAWEKQSCKEQVRIVSRAARSGVALRAIDLGELRRQDPLPKSADELCAVAATLGALSQEQETIWLGERATERSLKSLSRGDKLLSYKVVHFATHGLLWAESESILKASPEPALIN